MVENKMGQNLKTKFKIFTDVLPFGIHYRFFDYIYSSRYAIGWADRLDQKSIDYLVSNWTKLDVDNSTFFTNIKNKELINIINNKVLSRAIVNLCLPHETYYPHTHEGETMVYYPNPIWYSDWYGETFIYEDDGKTIHACIPYTPNSALWFDKNVVHSIRPPNFSAKQRRFTFACHFDQGQALQ